GQVRLLSHSYSHDFSHFPPSLTLPGVGSILPSKYITTELLIPAIFGHFPSSFSGLCRVPRCRTL
ncbi:hypothetical protein BDZ91DRAFT_725564, partial [Kalaharituber pfeilii]